MKNQFVNKNKTSELSNSIYEQSEVKTEKEILKEMNMKEKITYFNDYYRTKTIFILGLFIIAICFIVSMVSPKPKIILYTAIINNVIDDTTAEILKNDFGKYEKINTKKQTIFIDTSYNLEWETEMSQSYSVASEVRLGAFLVSSQIDVVIAPEAVFTSYAQNGSMSKLSEQLPSDLYQSLSDSYYYSQTETDKTQSSYGIYLDKVTIYDKCGKKIDKPVLGIAAATQNNKYVVDFIRYLFQL